MFQCERERKMCCTYSTQAACYTLTVLLSTKTFFLNEKEKSVKIIIETTC